MTAVPPPYEYASRDSAQVSHSTAIPPFQGPSTQFEFSESTAVTLEWRVSGLKAMYDGTKGETKSKCIRSAVFGDVDNLWEVLFYPNSGAAGGENASLYLSCAPTPQEVEAGKYGTDKWTRKGIWWFRFEIRSSIPDERTGKIAILAAKDAADHTFANKTANWGWQLFGTRTVLFRHPAVIAADSFIIACTVQAQPQPPAGYWLGMGLPVNGWVPATTVVNGKTVGSGGGLSAWTGSEGASGGVAGGTTAGGGVKRVVPRELVSGVGALLDDPLYSDVEFIIPNRYSRGQGSDGIESSKARGSRRIYANKKLLERCDYFRAMFRGGFGEVEEDEHEVDSDALSDSDEEDETAEQYPGSGPRRSLSPTPPRPSSRHSTRKTSVSGDRSDNDARMETGDEEDGTDKLVVEEDEERSGPPAGQGGTAGTEDEGIGGPSGGVTGSEAGTGSTSTMSAASGGPKREVGADRPKMTKEGAAAGPKKTKVVIRDAAWSTWWAVLYWLYTDNIYFAPLTSTFTHPSPATNPTPASRPGSISSLPQPPPHRFRSRAEWIRHWMHEHNIALSPSSTSGDPLGPRPVSAKAVYRLADKLDLQALKLRAFQHIIAGLTSQNVPAEVFSRFSSTFEDVRKVQVAYFLKHWTDIKKSDTMMQIWQQIRVGKHVGFEEVWPLIVGQLDFKPS